MKSLFRIEFLLFAVILLTGPVIALARPATGAGPVIVIAGWSGVAPVLARAEAWEVGIAQPRIGRVVTGDGADLVQRLHEAGAWIVLDADRAAWICGV